MAKQTPKAVYLRGKDETDKDAARRAKKLKKLAKNLKCSESAVFCRLLDNVTLDS